MNIVSVSKKRGSYQFYLSLYLKVIMLINKNPFKEQMFVV